MSGIETITPWATPDHRTYEQRILATLEEIRDAIRELATQTAIAAKAPVDMDDFVYSPRKPAAALKPGKRK